MRADVVVIGGGLAGLSAAIGAQRTGAQTTLVSSGMGILYLNSGNIHLMAYPNGAGDSPVISPLEAIADLRKENPDHPYSKMDEEEICRSLDQFISSCGNQELHLIGDGRKNLKLLTALGTGNPCGITQTTMVHGDLNDDRPMVLVGFEGYREFFPELVIQRIEANTTLAIRSIQFDPAEAMGSGIVNTVNLGRAFEEMEICEEFAAFIKENTQLEERVGIPAVLGVDGAERVFRTIEELTGRALFEISILPPSLPGRRIYQALKRELFELGGQIVNGCPVIHAEIQKGRIHSLTYQAGDQKRTLTAKTFVLASGSFFSGGLICEKEILKEEEELAKEKEETESDEE